MIEVTILIPVRDNDGKLFTDSDHQAFESYVAERFVGITQFQGNAIGTWVDEGTTYQDRTRVYGFAVPSITDGEKVREIVSFAKTHYRQLAIYIRYLGLAEVL